MTLPDHPRPPSGYTHETRQYNKPKKSTNGNPLASRSHKHLHPQSHPFAHKVAATDGAAASPDEGEIVSSPVLRLRGLPFSATVEDVRAFFAEHQVADLLSENAGVMKLLAKGNGKPSGQCVVQMRSIEDAETAAAALDKQYVGGRYIEVFVYGEDFPIEQPDKDEPAVPPGEFFHDRPGEADPEVPPGDFREGAAESCEDAEEPSTVQLRGLPFRTTINEINTFLGPYAQKLIAEQPIRLLLNRDNRPSGFARVHFVSPEDAKEAMANLHRNMMGNRYIEVLPAKRSNKQTRQRITSGDDAGITGDPQDVLHDARQHLGLSGNQGMLCSALGIALSPQSRSYLRSQSLGLKHFLMRYNDEFHVAGPKGSETVTWNHLPGTTPEIEKLRSQIQKLEEMNDEDMEDALQLKRGKLKALEEALRQPEALNVGDRVRVRDNGEEDWKHGVVTSAEPLEVRPDGWKDGITWDFVESLEAKQPTKQPAKRPAKQPAKPSAKLPAKTPPAPPWRQPDKAANAAEWTCSCGFRNRAANDICGGHGPMGCNLSREDGAIQAAQATEWRCSSCGFQNRAMNVVCGGTGPSGCNRPRDEVVSERGFKRSCGSSDSGGDWEDDDRRGAPSKRPRPSAEATDSRARPSGAPSKPKESFSAAQKRSAADEPSRVPTRARTDASPGQLVKSLLSEAQFFKASQNRLETWDCS